MINLRDYVCEVFKEQVGSKITLSDLKSKGFPVELIDACAKYIDSESVSMIDRTADFLTNSSRKKIRQLSEMEYNLEKEIYKAKGKDWTLYVYKYQDNTWIDYSTDNLDEYYFFQINDR